MSETTSNINDIDITPLIEAFEQFTKAVKKIMEDIAEWFSKIYNKSKEYNKICKNHVYKNYDKRYCIKYNNPILSKKLSWHLFRKIKQ